MPLGEPRVTYDVNPDDLDFDKLFLALVRVGPPDNELMPCLPIKTPTGPAVSFLHQHNIRVFVLCSVTICSLYGPLKNQGKVKVEVKVFFHVF